MTRLLCVAPNPSIDRLIEVDRLTLGSIHRPGLVQAVAGGKGLNVARAAVSLGASVTAVGIAAGHAGRWLAEATAADGVDGHFAWSSGETRICTSIADRATGTLTEIYEPGPTIDEATWSGFGSLLADRLSAAPWDASSISGSLPPGSPADGLAQLLAVADAAGVPAAVDGFFPRAGGTTWSDILALGPWLIKANADEAGSFTGSTVTGPDDAIRAASAFVQAGASAAIVTLGTQGAVARLDGADWRISPPDGIDPYPVGSGDAFLAGFLVGRLEGLTTDARLALAAGAASANARRPGAGSFDAAEARRIAVTVKVERLDEVEGP